MIKTITYLILLLLITLASCTNETEDAPISQGVLDYDITYPSLKNSKKKLLIAGLPKHLLITYKGDLYKTEVKHGLMKFKTTLITDTKNKKLTAILKLGKKKVFSVMNDEEVDLFLSKFPKVQYLNETKTDSAFGFLTYRNVAIFDDLSEEVHLRYTKDLGITTPNWCNPFNEIDGMLLEYGFEFYGIGMHFNAKVWEQKPIDDSEFEVPDDYTKVPYKEISDEINTLFSIVL